MIELKSRVSQDVPEKAEQPKKPVNTACQEVLDKAEPPKKPDNTASQEVLEEAEQPKKPVKNPLKRLAKNPKVQVKKIDIHIRKYQRQLSKQKSL